MRIVSVNAWGGAMFESLAAWLPTVDADVVCLQEVTRTAGASGATHFADGERSLPQRANLFDDVSQLLPSHQSMFVASDAGPVLDDRGVTLRQDFGLAMFVSDRLPVVGSAAEFVHGSFVDHEQWAIEDRPRIAQAVRVVDRAKDRVVTVAHVHGLRDPAGKHDTPARQGQAERLATFLANVRRPDDFTVFAGDLNLLPDAETFEILGRIGLTDLVGDQDTRTSRYTKACRHANYLLVSDPHMVESFAIVEQPEVSDHRPLVLDV